VVRRLELSEGNGGHHCEEMKMRSERTGFEEPVEDLDGVVKGRVVQGGVSVVVLGLDAGPVLQQQHHRLDGVVGRTGVG
jgi:hypothetical protein